MKILLLSLYFTGIASTLGDLAQSMQPDSWAALNTNGITTSTLLESGGNTGFITGDASNGCWDPVKQQAHFIGKGHNDGVPVTHAVYDAATNTWVRRPDPDGQTGWTRSGGEGHGWEYGPVYDPKGRSLYRGFYYSLKLWKYNLDTQQWSTIVTAPSTVMSYPSFMGVAFNPDRGTAGQILIASTESGTSGVLAQYDVATASWARVVPQLFSGFPNSVCFAEHNVTSHYTMLGGAGSAAYKIDPQGAVTSTAAFPGCVPYDNRNGIVQADPATGNFVMLCGGGSASWHIYNPVSNSWTSKPTPSGVADHILAAPISSPWPTWGVIGIPITDHGVIMYVKCNGGGCAVRLYKGGAFSSSVSSLKTPETFKLDAAPNPFRSSVTLNFGASDEITAVKIFDLNGRRVELLQENSTGEYEWRPGTVPGGVYLVKAEVEGRTLLKKITLLR